MRIEVLKQNLSPLLSKIDRFTGKSLDLPILGCVLVVADTNTCFVRATNLDIGIEASIPVKVLEGGSVAIPALILSQFMAHIHDDERITLETKDGILLVTTPRRNARIKTLPPSDFPVIPRVSNDPHTITVSTKNFREGVQSVWYSASLSSVRPELSSVFMTVRDSVMIFAATDGFRLAEKRIPLIKDTSLDCLMIPLKNIPLILRILDGVSGDISLTFNKNQLEIIAPGLRISSRVIDGSFPDYQALIPLSFTTEAVVLKQDLVDSLKITNIFSGSFHRVIKTISPQNKLFSIETENKDVGDHRENIPASLSGDDVRAAFNHRFVADCLSSVPGDSVSLQFSGEEKPVIIRGLPRESFTYMVMPMHRE